MACFFSDTALSLLLSSAEAIEDGDLKSADAFLHNILCLADEGPKYWRDQSRVVKYFAEALVHRAYGLQYPSSSHVSFPVNPARYYHYNIYNINDVIKKVITNAVMGKRRLHLVDFSIPHYCSEDSVLRTIPILFNGTPPTLCDPLTARVSYILPPFLKKHVDFKRSREEAKELEKNLGDEFKEVYASSLAEVDECEIDFESREDEMVVVYYKFKLHKLLIDAKAMKRELVRLREINPAVVIMLDFYANHNDSNFLTCFKDSFQYSLKTLNCWGEYFFFKEEYEWECNIEAWEGNNVIRRHPTLTEWQHLFSMASFSRIPLNHRKGIDLSVGDLEIMGEEERYLILGFSPIPSPLPPLQPFPEGLALNRLAIFAKIDDILNHLCCERISFH
ncbi:hypothetical protein J1N35_012888 [Gossypium stocksii]|uniref:Uncharacterized protein n=1 Tax=Gossypium stocksii TaxID=47602 RepID=A0A9D3VRI9_9ROSI|nr:hypothetical protein J1N35_012888 [Gossypium stocksii]